MKIFYFHQHYSPIGGTGNNRSLELSQEWVKTGNEVTIICGSGNFKNKLPFFKLYHSFEENGVQIIRLNVNYSHFFSFYNRIYSFVKYLFVCILLTTKWKKADIIYASSTPLTVGLTGFWLKKIYKKSFVFEVVDLWPDVPIDMGIITSSKLIHFLKWIELNIYKEADHIVCLSEGMKEKIETKINDDKISVIPNGTNCRMFKLTENKALNKTSLGFQEDTFLVLYAGTIGEANGIEFLVDLAEKVSYMKSDKIHFVIVGDGNRKTNVIEYAESKSLSNITFHNQVSKEKIKNYLEAADAGIVCFKNYTILNTNSANKFFDYLAAGLPVFINYAGWQSIYISEYHCGYSEVNTSELAEKIVWFSKQTDLIKISSINARNLAVLKFDRKNLASDVLRIFSKLHAN